MADPIAPAAPKPLPHPSPEPQAPAQAEEKSESYYIINLADPDHLMGRARMLYAAQTLGNSESFFQDQQGPGFALDTGIKLRFDDHMAWGGVGYQFHHTSRDLPTRGSSYLNTHRFGLTGGYRYHLVPEWFSLGLETFLGFSKFSSYSSILSLGDHKDYDPREGTVYNGNPNAHPVHSFALATQIGVNVGIWRDIISVGFLLGGDWGGQVKVDSLDPGQGSYHESIRPLTMMFSLGVEIPSLFSDRTW